MLSRKTLLSLALLCPFLSALEVLFPPSLAGTSFDAPTYGKFFGAQSGFNITASAVLFSGDICSMTRNERFAGKVLVYTRDRRLRACSLNKRYDNLERTGAVAAVESWRFNGEHDVPGYMYHQHDDWNPTRPHSKSMPWLQVNKHKFGSVLTYLEQGGDVVLRVTPNDNQWRPVFESVVFIAIMRVFLPIMCFMSSCFGVSTLRALAHQSGRTTTTTQQFAVTIETVCLFLQGTCLAMSGVYGSDLLPWPLLPWFGTAMGGWSYFTTFLVAMHWRCVQKSSEKLQKAPNVLREHWLLVACVFVVFVGMDISLNLLIAIHFNSVVLLGIGTVVYAAANFVTLIFFVFHCTRFLKTIKVRVKKKIRSNRKLNFESLLKHLAKWLLFTSFFMLLNVVSYLLFSGSFAWTPKGSLACLGLLHFSRCGVGLTQILAWRAPSVKGSTIVPVPTPVYHQPEPTHPDFSPQPTQTDDYV